ncbi:hypothetical protein NT6N_36100 [Oceaniferula spumae]|uniref:Sialate O-acetylesterase n=1 Tax=Oceaniferula spumae TaxID=2979115 RepID=A0AAT9FRL4_9BACT
MRNVRMVYYLATIGCLLISQAVALELALPFTDHAVLQHGQPLPVWGIADAGADVKVKLGDHSASTRANSKGAWKVEFPAEKPSAKPFKGVQMEVVSGDQKITRDDLLFGDVWIATGQSNMRWMLKQCDNGKDAIAASADDGLRLLNFEGSLHPGGKKYSMEFLTQMTPQNYYKSDGWQASSPKSSPNFSGVAYFFGKKLREELEIPIGLIQLAVGGTPIEAHMPKKAFESDSDLRPLLKTWWKNPDYPRWCRNRAALNLTHWLADPPKGQEPPHPFAPSFLWQAGIDPLLPFPVKGVIWYQGESNAGRDGSPEAITDGSLNKKKMKALITAWRDAWGNEMLPVYYAQLPGLNRKWPVFREMQLELSQEVDNVGMVVTIDVGHPTNVHPNKKQPVGDRLARLAMAGTYGKKVVPNGPIFQRHVVKKGQVFIDFKNKAGLKASDGDEIRGFEVAGSDKKFHPGTATVSGEYLVVQSDHVRSPAAVRYAWANDPDCNLVNAEGLPASPFRTDRWKDVSPSGNVDKGKKKDVKVRPTGDQIRVACIGDSITYGAGISNRDLTYPKQLQDLLGKQYVVKNFGNSGRGIVKKSMRGRQKRAFIFMKEHKEALKFQPQIVICNLGINDLMDWEKFGKDDFINDYRELINAYQSLPGKPRIIIWKNLAPLYRGQAFFGDPRVSKINDAIGKVAELEKVEVVDMEKPLSGHSDWFPDHIHPNAEGAKKIAEVTATVLTTKK